MADLFVKKPLTPVDERHGTYAGFLAHRSAGQAPCESCRLARNEYVRELRKDPKNLKRHKEGMQAQERALRDLSHLHNDEYQALYAKHLGEIRRVRHG